MSSDRLQCATRGEKNVKIFFSVNIASIISARISGTEVAVGTFQMVGSDKALNMKVIYKTNEMHQIHNLYYN
jgi:hypothetical protein